MGIWVRAPGSRALAAGEARPRLCPGGEGAGASALWMPAAPRHLPPFVRAPRSDPRTSVGSQRSPGAGLGGRGAAARGRGAAGNRAQKARGSPAALPGAPRRLATRDLGGESLGPALASARPGVGNPDPGGSGGCGRPRSTRPGDVGGACVRGRPWGPVRCQKRGQGRARRGHPRGWGLSAMETPPGIGRAAGAGAGPALGPVLLGLLLAGRAPFSPRQFAVY